MEEEAKERALPLGTRVLRYVEIKPRFPTLTSTYFLGSFVDNMQVQHRNLMDGWCFFFSFSESPSNRSKWIWSAYGLVWLCHMDSYCVFVAASTQVRWARWWDAPGRVPARDLGGAWNGATAYSGGVYRDGFFLWRCLSVGVSKICVKQPASGVLAASLEGGTLEKCRAAAEALCPGGRKWSSRTNGDLGTKEDWRRGSLESNGGRVERCRAESLNLRTPYFQESTKKKSWKNELCDQQCLCDCQKEKGSQRTTDPIHNSFQIASICFFLCPWH